MALKRKPLGASQIAVDDATGAQATCRGDTLLGVSYITVSTAASLATLVAQSSTVGDKAISAECKSIALIPKSGDTIYYNRVYSSGQPTNADSVLQAMGLGCKKAETDAMGFYAASPSKFTLIQIG